MSILFYLLAGIAMTIAKGWQVHTQLCTHRYSWKGFVFVFLAWWAMTLPFIVSACDEFACQWSLRFGWWANLFQQVPLFDKLSSDTMVAVVMLAYVILTVYFLGECLGWALYGTRRLLRLAV